MTVIMKLVNTSFNWDGKQNFHTGDLLNTQGLFFRQVANLRHDASSKYGTGYWEI
jgi:hypothetical protein